MLWFWHWTLWKKISSIVCMIRMKKIKFQEATLSRKREITLLWHYMHAKWCISMKFIKQSENIDHPISKYFWQNKYNGSVFSLIIRSQSKKGKISHRVSISVFHWTLMSVCTVPLPLSVSLTSSVLQWTLMRWPSVPQWASVSVITETEMALPRCHQCSLSITVGDVSNQ